VVVLVDSIAADSTPPGTKELAAGAAAFHHRGGPSLVAECQSAAVHIFFAL
jgi:hypothetical protein